MFVILRNFLRTNLTFFWKTAAAISGNISLAILNRILKNNPKAIPEIREETSGQTFKRITRRMLKGTVR